MEPLPGFDQDDSLSSHIDPGFINHRKCISIFGDALVNAYHFHAGSSNDWLDKWKNNHIFVNLIMRFCKYEEIKTLPEVLWEHVTFARVG